MKKRNIPLSVKISFVSIAAMLVSLTIGLVTALTAHFNVASEYANKRMFLSVHNASHNINDSFTTIKTVVEDAQLLSSKYFQTTASLQDENAVSDSLDTIYNIYSLTAPQTDYVSGYWVFLNPEYSGLTAEDPEGDGFFYAKNEGTNEFVKQPVTNILKYDREKDKDKVQWWYGFVDKKVKKAEWLDPFYNGNVNNNIVSYAASFFSNDNKMLGMVGIDLDLDEIIASIKNAGGEYKTSNSFLLDSNGYVVYHKDVQTFDDQGRYVGSDKKLSDTIGYDVKNEEENIVVGYKYSGENRIVATNTLVNEMIYCLSVSRNEIYSSINSIIIAPVIAYASCTIALAAFILLGVRSMLKPLKKLNEAAVSVADGNLRVKVETKSNDELGTLTESFNFMVESLRKERKALNALAMKDGLTGVKNKLSQEEKVSELNNQIKEGIARFAVVMCDVDDLKYINDTFGHIRGDQVIRGSCLVLCNVFSRSPVYRIGGDEFVAILEGQDYDDREALFAKIVKLRKTDESGKFTFSVGMATYKQGVDTSFASVYERADEAMYEMKHTSKKS